ncbi:hypothetical protein D3C78_1609080 [compost metagenome]
MICNEYKGRITIIGVILPLFILIIVPVFLKNQLEELYEKYILLVFCPTAEL